MKCLLCSYFKYPQGDAGAIRHEKFAQMLLAMGHEVLVIGLGKPTHFKVKEEKGINYTSFRYDKDSFLGKAFSYFFFQRNLKKYIKSFSPDVLLIDDLRPFVMLFLRRKCAKKGIKLIHDSVEWYSHEQFSRGKRDPMYVMKNWVNKSVVNQKYRVIAISSYLESHFKSKRIECVRIPIVVSDEDLVKEKRLSATLQLTYAGQPGRKDYLHVMLQALSLLPKDTLSKLRFHIVGASYDQLISSGIEESLLTELSNALVIHGRVDRQEGLEILKASDFTVLIRSEEQRYAKAGFPTKAIESLSHSTPMIANLTSDLGRYLQDGYNALVVPACDAEALAHTINRAVGLSAEERMKMCMNAYATAKEQLHYNNFMDDLSKIIQ